MPRQAESIRTSSCRLPRRRDRRACRCRLHPRAHRGRRWLLRCLVDGAPADRGGDHQEHAALQVNSGMRGPGGLGDEQVRYEAGQMWRAAAFRLGERRHTAPTCRRAPAPHLVRRHGRDARRPAAATTSTSTPGPGRDDHRQVGHASPSGWSRTHGDARARATRSTSTRTSSTARSTSSTRRPQLQVILAPVDGRGRIRARRRRGRRALGLAPVTARPVTLFTGQWADLPLEELAAKAAAIGFDGLELACWGDHFEVDRAPRRGRPYGARDAVAPRASRPGVLGPRSSPRGPSGLRPH